MPSLPLIAVTVGRLPSGNRVIDGTDRDYGRAIQIAGGVPVLIPAVPDTDARAVLPRVDGLVLSGGGDIDPGAYGAETSPATGGVDPSRDAGEFRLLEAALDLGLPVLGICRGCQLVNVALGGTLHQHLPDLTPTAHLRSDARDMISHSVALERGSRLHKVVGRAEIGVNSIHHQAVARLAPALRAVACSPDGIIEAVEDPDRDLLAVQWHPESLVPAEPHLALFEWLMEACS